MSDLIGAELDAAVARALGIDALAYVDGIVRLDNGYSPSTDWSKGGPIIERERIGLWYGVLMIYRDGKIIEDPDGPKWWSDGPRPEGCSREIDETYAVVSGHTPLIAAMRAFIASKT